MPDSGSVPRSLLIEAEFKHYKGLIAQHDWLQTRQAYRNGNNVVEHWKHHPEREEDNYSFVTGAIFDHRNKFLRRIDTPEL